MLHQSGEAIVGQEPNCVRNINENGLNRLLGYGSTSKLFLFSWSRDSCVSERFSVLVLVSVCVCFVNSSFHKKKRS